MNTEVGGGSRTLKSINGLITATLVCVVLGALAWVAAYLLSLDILYAVAGALAVAAVVPLFLMFGRVRAVEADIAHREALSLAQRKETERNQQAILRLLDELAPLADGDLTVQATVTEDITGTIADSINYAIGVLRDLVSTINQSAIQLDGATRQTQALSAHLAKASSAQSKQIAGATESASNMASSTEAISGNSERASDVARHSVDVAHKGGDAVRRTIDGMNSIRETIQETSKRIKRLGESSQEIGNIVELINDIAEQTNILALNASIQASMAGDAGRGFAVVADEVQRLAERAAAATRQIETLVRAIQADTNEAVVSMERSTTDVVGGALLAENAGAALEEIEQVLSQIASLVNNIFSSSREQVTEAQKIARNMQVLKEISTQTAESTTATSQSISNRYLIAQWKREIDPGAEGDFSPFLALRLRNGKLFATVETNYVAPEHGGTNGFPHHCGSGPVPVWFRPRTNQMRALVATDGSWRPEDGAQFSDCTQAIKVIDHGNKLPSPNSGWIDFAVFTKPGPDGSGHIEIVANGKPIVTVKGQIGHSDKGLGKNQYFKFGPYRAAHANVWTLYYDDFRRSPNCSDVLGDVSCLAP